MNITIVGGGNIGTQFAVHCAEKKNDVIVFTSTPELFDGSLYIVDEGGTITHEGVIMCATHDPSKAFCNADLIIVTVPPNMMSSVADVIFEYSNKNAIIGIVPGNGGSECALRECINRGNTVFSIERVPAIARLEKKGKVVKSTGYRNELHVAAIPRGCAKTCSRIINYIFDIPCTTIPNMLNLTMTPSNPILHTTRLYSIFKEWHEGIVYDYVPLFYEEWNDASSELLIACDEEVQKICRALPEFHLEYVKSLREHYESPTVKQMTKKISSIDAFKGLHTPTVRVGEKLIPDLHSRYFIADFSYGLSIIKQVAEFAEVDTPEIDKVLAWYKGIAIEKNEFNFKDYGIIDRKTLEQFYLNN